MNGNKDLGKHIDPHVHCRDWEQSYKATIKSVTELARSQGIVAIFDMPNTDPPITTRELAERRIATAKAEGCLDGYYLYMGLTSDPKQIKEIAEVVKSNHKVIGIKMYAGKSTGDLTVSDAPSQKRAYETLAEVNYTGVLAVHCEKDSLGHPELWDPSKPYTWNTSRPPIMEVESLKDQIKFVKESGFKGHLHICHISIPESVEIVQEAKSKIRITSGVTPHHVTISTQDMKGENGMAYKVNPPIREPEIKKKMLSLLKEGKIDWIETDHAPHTKEEKAYVPNGKFMSGIQSMANYSSFLQGLLKEGFTEKQIHEITYSNIKKVFTKVTE